MQNQRNLILAIVLTGLVLFGWEMAMSHFYPKPTKPVPTATATVAADGSPAKPK